MWEDTTMTHTESRFHWSDDSGLWISANVTTQQDGSASWHARIRNNAAHGSAPDVTRGRARALKALVCLAMLDDLEHGRHMAWPDEITKHDLWREVAL